MTDATSRPRCSCNHSGTCIACLVWNLVFEKYGDGGLIYLQGLSDRSEIGKQVDPATFELIDAVIALLEKHTGVIYGLEGFDRVSMAIHNHPASHIDTAKRQAAPSASGDTGQLQALWSLVRLKAEGSDWKRDQGETVVEWAARALFPSTVSASSLTEELRVTDALLEARNRVLQSIPGCEAHGEQCVPHALEWIEKAKAALSSTGEPLRALLLRAADRLCAEITATDDGRMDPLLQDIYHALSAPAAPLSATATRESVIEECAVKIEGLRTGHDHPDNKRQDGTLSFAARELRALAAMDSRSEGT
jgi:hypothetical protein